MAQAKDSLILLWLSSAWFTADATSKTQALRAVLDHFNSTRNNVVDPVAKQRTRDVIVNTFIDHGLNTWLEEFPTNNPQYPGFNIVGRLPGRYTGTRDDKIVLIGAHYDSVSSTPGVDDNGSGMTSLLQTLKLFMSSDKLTCSRDYSLLFVAFDLEEYQPPCARPGNCSCSSGLCGSQYFVQNFTSYLNSSGAHFQGALILETILNYNSTPNSQQLPAGTNILLPKIYQQLEENQFRGDFLSVIGRQQDDGRIIGNITKAFNSDENFKLISVELPYSGRPSKWQFANLLRDFFRSDHYRFWNNHPSLPAIFVTDSADFRGFMQECYHKRCDDISQVTPEMLTFLSRTTDSLVEVASEMSNERCQMKSKDCGLSVMESEGQITTPYFNSKYPNNISCAWIIKVDSEQAKLRLKFTAFDLEESINCTADRVEIRDGDSATAPIIGKYCGKALPQPINASARSLYVSFHSDDLDAFKGFQAEWSSTPVTKSAALRHLTGHCQRMLQLIGLLVMASLIHIS